MRPMFILMAGATLLALVMLMIVITMRSKPPVQATTSDGGLPTSSSLSTSTTTSTPTSTSVPSSSVGLTWPPQPAWVTLPNGRKYKPAWPWKPGMDPPGIPTEQYKWKFVHGLETKKGLSELPNTPEDESWNPFAAPGQKVVDGGIMVPIGDLPVVNPPAQYRKAPYMMRPMWQEGSTETNDYYKKHCTHLVLSRGKLHYFGPGKRAVGGYAWRFKGPTDQYGNMRDGKGGVSTQPFEAELYGGIDENTIMTDLLQGIELKPWFRRGPLSKSTLPVLKKWCRPDVKPNPKCEHPTQLGVTGPRCGSA